MPGSPTKKKLTLAKAPPKSKGVNLTVSVKKLGVQTGDTLRVFLVVWNDTGDLFLDHVRFVSPQENIRIHVFFNKTIKNSPEITSLKDRLKSHLVLHESLTECTDASWTDLLAYLINFCTKRLISCHHCSVVHPQPVCKVHLVSGQQERYSELQALLTSNKAQITVLDGRVRTLLDMFSHVCNGCELVFASASEADNHDRMAHNYLCSNPACERSRRDNGFFTREEHLAHEACKQICKFCEAQQFCDIFKYEAHMKSYHVLCSCPCGEYYRTTDDYLQHYCSLFPLPCLEDVMCNERFRNIDEQAFHHKSAHGASHPFYCVACYGTAKLVCLRTADELLSHVSTFKHTKLDFDFTMYPKLDETS